MQSTYLYKFLSLHALNHHSTKTVFQIFLEPKDKKMSYKAGQYIEIQYPDGSFQPFSIANASNPSGILELLIRSPENKSTHQAFLNHLPSAEAVRLMGPFGKCTSDLFTQKPSLLLSGGVGFAQSKAIIEQRILEKPMPFTHLYWGIQNPEALFLENLLREWQSTLPQFKYTVVFSESQPTLSSNQKNGYVQEAVIQDYPTLENYHVLVSGPREMVMASKELYQRGLFEKNLYSDWFDFL